MRHLNIIMALGLVLCSCNEIVSSVDYTSEQPSVTSLSQVALMLSSVPLQAEQLGEVHDAVSSSITNGYDEEYTMGNLFSSPGCGVGDEGLDTKASSYGTPLRDLLKDYIYNLYQTKSGTSEDAKADEDIKTLESSDIQIYWPYSDSWDGYTMPVITYAPTGDSESNYGYQIVDNPDGSRDLEQVVVTEEMAQERPVWVVNRNDDSRYKTLEVLRRDDPEWGLVLKDNHDTKADESDFKSLYLKDLTTSRNYDTWFGGASEFWIKVGAVEDFTASTEAELRLYSPSVTDVLIVVKRSQKGKKIPYHTLLISRWTDQLESVAFMITEDDGGTQTSWKCSSTVKIKSKSYGFDIEIPINVRDDIVWRGQLATSFFERYNGTAGNFGDVSLSFEII